MLITNNNNNKEEQLYLDTVRDVITTGQLNSQERTGTGTYSKFGTMMRYNLENDRFPLFTTKRMNFHIVFEEWKWMIQGHTDSTLLSDKKVHIWDADGSKEKLVQRGFSHREEGDLGPIYGHQWRHFNAPYVDFHTDYSGKGIDQIAQVIHQLKTDPQSRRMIVMAWNPCQLREMSLPPCHMSFQFQVGSNKTLSCMMNQRSADLMLGVPYNVAFYSLMTKAVAHICDMVPFEFIHSIGDYHIYKDHLEGAKTQLSRTPSAFPTIKIVDRKQKTLEEFEESDFLLQEYHPQNFIKFPQSS